ncbi:hypothetical protein KK101_10650 [Curtobacterium flaccumfaciens pv. oortii]|uniref:hypothetical protein n=1 Tax=Curtobacterium flaccumfaciens TaxID=2035 RepID=UPI001BDDDFD1|nr:hypothetical protein [Curtobacterium flaccumfaciens]MBT1623144.1 hypothetical protein [Curtobacterium flaccumfaciens pv. oortii]
MTEAQTAADRRWADAEIRAHAYLAQPRDRRVVPIRGFVLAVALVIALLVLVGVALPPDSDARLMLSTVGLSIAVLILVVEIIRAVRFRRRAGRTVVREQVVASLLQREQRAVSRAAVGQADAPADRRIVVDAVATDLASGDALPMQAGLLVVWSSIAVAGTAFWSVYLIGSLFTVAQFLWSVRRTVLARRCLVAPHRMDVDPVRPRS